MTIEFRIPASGSLKDKRKVVKHLIETSRSRFGVAAAEVGHHERWQRAELGFAAVASSHSHIEEVLDTIERFVWSHPEIEIIEHRRSWVDPD